MTKRFNTYLFYGVLIFVLTVAFIPKEIYEQTSYFQNDDKIKHFLAFFVLSFLYLRDSFSLDIKLKVMILISIAFLIEVLQSFLNREFSLFDFLASVLGVVFCLVVRYFLKG